MSAKQLMLPANRAFDSNGFPEAGATVKLYESGTTTPANFYADSALTISLGSTLTANAAGRLVIPAYQDSVTPFRIKIFDAAGDELDDIDPYYFGAAYSVIETTASTNVASRTAMAAISGVAGAVVNLTETNRQGAFIFDSSNLSARVTADTLQGIYVAPSTDPTGASGAWVRMFTGPADIRWFGASATGTPASNKTAIQVAINVAGYISIPAGYTFASTGGIVLPSNAFICGPGTIDFDASATTHLFILGAATGTGSVTASTIHILGVDFICNDDIAFANFIRFENSGGTTDRVFINDNTITYSGVPSTGDDRWFVAASSGTIGAPTWSNVQICRNTISGPMQLVANAANSNSKHWEIAHNKIYNARANAIFVSAGSGVSTNPATAEDFNIHDNQIWADAYTSCGILIGLDSSAGDRDVNLRRIRVANNTIYLGWASGTWGIGFRSGNDCSGIGGFLSDMSGITIHGNTIYTQAGQDAIHIETVPVTTAAVAYFTDLLISNNLVLQGDVSIGGISEGELKGNVVRGNFKPTQSSLVLRSTGNTYETLAPATAATFEMHSHYDTFVGHAPATAVDEYPIDLAPAAATTQTLYLNHATVNSRKTDVTRRKSAVRTSGAGTAAVTVRRLATDTTWNAGLYTVTTGTITDYDRTTTYTPTVTANINCTTLSATKATYERKEQYVEVDALIALTASAAGACRADITLPVASTLATSADVIGTGSVIATTPLPVYVQGVTGTNVARLAFNASGAGAVTINVRFKYEIK
jgi:hypothetical protein